MGVISMEKHHIAQVAKPFHSTWPSLSVHLKVTPTGPPDPDYSQIVVRYISSNVHPQNITVKHMHAALQRMIRVSF